MISGCYDRATVSGSGIVDQEVHGDPVLPGPGVHHLGRGRLGQILGQDLHTDSMLPVQILGDQIQSFLVSGNQGQVPAMGSQLASQGCPDPGRSSSNQGCAKVLNCWLIGRLRHLHFSPELRRP
jgi:hypothetical protein